MTRQGVLQRGVDRTRRGDANPEGRFPVEAKQWWRRRQGGLVTAPWDAPGRVRPTRGSVEPDLRRVPVRVRDPGSAPVGPVGAASVPAGTDPVASDRADVGPVPRCARSSDFLLSSDRLGGSWSVLPDRDEFRVRTGFRGRGRPRPRGPGNPPVRNPRRRPRVRCRGASPSPRAKADSTDFPPAR